MRDKVKIEYDKVTDENCRKYGLYRELVTATNVFLAQIRYKIDHGI